MARRKMGRPRVGDGSDKVVHLRCSAKQKRMWASKGGPGGMTQWIIRRLDDHADSAILAVDEAQGAAESLGEAANSVVLAIKRIRRQEGVTHAKQVEHLLITAAHAMAEIQDMLEDSLA